MTGRPPGAALASAYRSPANSPRALIELTHPHAQTAGLRADGTGVMLDPRIGHEEKSESFSLSCSPEDSAALMHRMGGDGRGWNAITWLMEYGNGGAGMSAGEAARLLIERAGGIDQPREPGSGRKIPSPPLLSSGEQLQREQKALPPKHPIDILDHLKTWQSIQEWQSTRPQEAGDSLELAFLRSRGLPQAVEVGLLAAFHFYEHTGDAREGRSPSQNLLPGAMGFLIRGPDGEPVGVKFRNPGTKQDLEAASERMGRKIRRYHIPRGMGTPAWCSPDLLTAPGEIWCEGELSGVAFALALQTVEGKRAYGVQGIAGSEAAPHVQHDLTGRFIYIYADPDEAGRTARLRWAEQATDLGAIVYMLPAFSNDDIELDAAAYLGANGEEALGAWLLKHLQELTPWQSTSEPAEPVPDVWSEGYTVWPYGYGIRNGGIVKLSVSEHGERSRPLLDFTARIVSEISRDDGENQPVGAYLIEGKDAQGRSFPPLMVPHAEFRNLSWADAWGVRAFVFPGTSNREEARAAIQRLSLEAGVTQQTVYTHTGWQMIADHGPVFLTAGSCIAASGAVPGLQVELPGRLSHYSLPTPIDGPVLRAAVKASLDLIELAPDSVSIPLIGMTYRAPLGDVDFTAWAAGRTGSGKTTLAALFQAHYGAGWNARQLPASWQGTANALSREAFLAKDVLFVLDDFKPEGRQADIDKSHAELSKLLGSVGDRAGRSRMLPDGITVRTGPYPRGAVLTTAEDSPRKTSDVARTVAVDVAAPLFGAGASSGASQRFEEARQGAASGVYAQAMSGYIRWIAQHHAKLTGEALQRRVRASAPQFAAPHARTPENAAELLEGWRAFLSFAVSINAVSNTEAEEYRLRVVAALNNLASGQATHLGNTDPAGRFLRLLSSLLRTGAVYVRDAETGEQPADYTEALGWHLQPSRSDSAQIQGGWETGRIGVPVGYYGNVSGKPFLFLEPEAVYAAVNRAAEQGGHALSAPRTLWKLLRGRLEESGAMICEKDRATHPRRVHGAGSHDGRAALLNISWPLPDDDGTNGTATATSPSQSRKNPVPFLFSFSEEIKLNGTDYSQILSQTEKPSVPFAPSALSVSAEKALSAPPYVLEMDE